LSKICDDTFEHRPRFLFIVEPHQVSEFRRKTDTVFQGAHIVDVSRGFAQKTYGILAKFG
jgi:hypothetical protein